MWHALSSVLQHDFAAPEPLDIARVLVRLVLAMALAAAIGVERELRGTTAGLRTHMLLALGVATIVTGAMEAGMSSDTVGRVLQGVLAGVGFIGGGAILKEDRKQVVKGLTTAASLWATAGIAAAAALGSGVVAVAATILALVILYVLWQVERRFGFGRHNEER